MEPPVDSATTGLLTESLLSAALNDASFDVRAMTEDQARAVERILGALPDLIERACDSGVRLGVLVAHVRDLALAVIDDDSDA